MKLQPNQSLHEKGTITWDIPMLKRFKKAHAKAVEDSFHFEGHEFLTSYAKYLIKYLDGVFNQK